MAAVVAMIVAAATIIGATATIVGVAATIDCSGLQFISNRIIFNCIYTPPIMFKTDYILIFLEEFD